MLDTAVNAKNNYLNGNPHPLEGIPIAIKDNMDVDGYPTTGGCPAFSGSPPKEFSCTLWKKLAS